MDKKHTGEKSKFAFSKYLSEHKEEIKRSKPNDFLLDKYGQQTIFSHNLSNGGKVMIVKKQSIY